MRSVPRGGDWSGVRCLIEAIRVSMLFLGLDEACAKRVTLLIRHVLVKMALKDLSNASNAKLNKAMRSPSASCKSTASTFSRKGNSRSGHEGSKTVCGQARRMDIRHRSVQHQVDAEFSGETSLRHGRIQVLHT